MTRILLTLIICAYVALAPAYAFAASEDVEIIRQNLQTQIDKLESNLNYKPTKTTSVGAAVEVTAKKTYPITVYDPNHPNVQKATLEAAKTATATVAPSAARIAKSMAKGTAGNLVALALFDMLGKAVDYVLDPANNQVKYTPKSDSDSYGCFKFNGSYFGKTPQQAIQNSFAYTTAEYAKNGRTVKYTYDNLKISQDGTQFSYDVHRTEDGQTITFNERKTCDLPIEQSVSLEALAVKAQDMAANGNGTAQDGIKTIVKEMITNNEIDNSYFDSHVTNDTYNDVVNNYITNNYNNVSNVTITQTPTGANVSFNTTGPSTNTNTNTNNTNNTNTNTNTNTGTGTDGKDASPFELPPFCSWATVVCDWISWTKEEPEQPDDRDVDIDDLDIPTDSFNINFGGQCPQPYRIDFSIAGRPMPIEISWSPVCDTAIILNPVIKLSSLLAAVMILAGIRRGDDNG